jgi:hypothetical protein
MELDVEMFRGKITERIRQMSIKRPQSYYCLHKMPRINYQDAINEQSLQLKQMEDSIPAYVEHVERCLAASKRHAISHLEFGEFRDPTERKLKAKLNILVCGKTDVKNETDDVKNEDSTSMSLPTRLQKFSGIHEQLQEQMDGLLSQVDSSGDGILQTDELHQAIDSNQRLQEEMSVLAVNLALCPENRLQTDNAERNQLLQEIIDGIAQHMDQNGDGLLSLEELKNAPAFLKDKMRRLGIDIKF